MITKVQMTPSLYSGYIQNNSQSKNKSNVNFTGFFDIFVGKATKKSANTIAETNISKPLIMSKPAMDIVENVHSVFEKAQKMINKNIHINGVTIKPESVYYPELSATAKDGTKVSVSELIEQDGFYVKLVNEAKNTSEKFSAYYGSLNGIKGAIDNNPNKIEFISSPEEMQRIENLITEYLPTINLQKATKKKPIS